MTLVGGKLWNWKWVPCIKMGCGSLFHYCMGNKLLVANEFTRLNLILTVPLKD
jgi:hypothetical protein